MSDAEAKLAAFWREDRPKASDAPFRLAVLERRSRQRFYRQTGWVAAGGAFVTACVAMIAPDLPALSVSQAMTDTIPFVSVVITGACILLAYARTRQTF